MIDKDEIAKKVIKDIQEKYPNIKVVYNGCGCHECGNETDNLWFTAYNVSDDIYVEFNDYCSHINYYCKHIKDTDCEIYIMSSRGDE